MTAFALDRSVTTTQVDRTALVRHVARRSPWRSIAASAAVCTGLLTIVAGSGDSSPLPFLRISTIVVAATTALAFDDSAFALTVSLPAGRRRQRLFSLTLAALAATIAGVSMLAVTSWLAPAGTELPTLSIAAELIGLMCFGWALAAVLADRLGTATHGRAVAGVVALSALVTAAIPATSDVLWVSNGPGANTSRWAWVTIAGAAIMCMWWSSSEPQPRRVNRWREA